MEFRVRKGSGIPAYQQIVQQAEQALRVGALRPGDKLPTAREVVAATAVNPNTVLRAYQELQRAGLVESRQGLGTFVVGTLGRAEGAAEELRGELDAWVAKAREQGLEREDVLALTAAAVDRQFRTADAGEPA
ncbi:GntR family transcriptional regulator [Streptacidiphilus jiangxiensis]|uniref:GntR family transcriptional regulator n=1 Tax=Streptacidiphilus jiangxiensis TaxID=235985 RepID=A0A1H7L519_STRJI|nr:GntR family transcriptional regulator [Streptacidiphilus jiangxiensis]SEK93890.1 GntR family transcriptional regulator [Streptacidiphilus jiangxiensis]